MNARLLVREGLFYGLIAGTLASALAIGLYFMGRHPLLVAPFLDFRLILFGVFQFFFLRDFRQNHQAGLLSFAQAFLGGFVMVIVASTVSGLLIMVFSQLVPEFVTEYISGAKAYLQTFDAETIKKIGQQEFDRNLKQLDATNGILLGQSYFVQGFAIGFLVNIILSVVSRRVPNSTN